MTGRRWRLLLHLPVFNHCSPISKDAYGNYFPWQGQVAIMYLMTADRDDANIGLLWFWSNPPV